MDKKNVCIVIGVTKNYTSQLATVILGIKKYCKDFYDDIIIYHDGIQNDIQEEFKKILNNIVFKNFNLVIDADNMPPLINEYSIIAFSRFECFNQLKYYKKVIWLDLDILIQRDISSLLSYGDKSGIALSINDCGFLNQSNFTEEIEKYNMYTPLYNAGMIVLSDNLDNYEEIAKWCYNILHEHGKKMLWCDQGIINLLIQEFDIEVEEIDINEYVCHPDRPYVHNSSIVHSYGKKKFWNSMSRDMKFPEWRVLVKEWANHVYRPDVLPKVSVIMSIYNRIEYIDDSIESILSQTLVNFELIIIVEFSKFQDEICEYLTKFDDKRIIIIKNTDHLGFAESLNKGLEVARGEYIARSDDDDYSVLERLQIQSDYLDCHPEIDIVGGYIECFGESNDLWNKISLSDDEIRIRLLFETQIYHPTVMMRASSLRKYNLKYSKGYFTEDYFLWAQAVSYCKFANIPQVLVRYRSSGKNITSTNENKINFSHIRVMDWQFKNYLNLELSYDELALLSKRKDILPNIIDKKSALKIKNEVINKIIQINRGVNFYNDKILSDLLIKGINNESISIASMNFSMTDRIFLHVFDFLLNKMKTLGILDKIKKNIYTAIHNHNYDTKL